MRHPGCRICVRKHEYANTDHRTLERNEGAYPKNTIVLSLRRSRFASLS